MGISGVGPKLALAILGALDATGLANAVATGDRTVFKGIPGVGKKTAERLLLELKDKLPRLAAGIPVAAPQRRAPSAATSELAKVSGALVQMGYKPLEAERAVAALSNTEGRAVEDLLREALGQLA
jgi:Holliday junction DNA helicase RuvA